MSIRSLRFKGADLRSFCPKLLICLTSALIATGAIAQDAPDSPPAAAVSGAGANWLETRIAIEELGEQGDFVAALELADVLLERASVQFGPESDALAESHLLLARTLRANRDYQLATEEFLAAIDIYELQDGPFSPRLIDPFIELGDTYSEAGDFQGAISSYQEARTLGRRTSGLLNLEQLPIIDLMTDAALELEEVEEARNLQYEALTLTERSFGEDSTEALEAQYKYALWLRDNQFFNEERLIYSEILRTIEREFEEDPLLTIRTLRARAASYREENNEESLGLTGLNQSLSLLEEMADPPLLLMAEVLLEIGDWNVEFKSSGSLGSEYTRAWQLLGQLDNGAELRQEWFGSLVEIERARLSPRGTSTDPNDPEGHVIVYFTVNRTGRTDDIEITESFPEGLKDTSVKLAMRDARFRPRVENGELVSARHAYRFSFRYVPEQDAED